MNGPLGVLAQWQFVRMTVVFFTLFPLRHLETNRKDFLRYRAKTATAFVLLNNQ